MAGVTTIPNGCRNDGLAEGYGGVALMERSTAMPISFF